MTPGVYNDFYLSTDHRLGSWSVVTEEPSAMQKANANNIKCFFQAERWTIEAICGMLGNMQGESTINPAFIQETNRARLPNSAQDLNDVPNDVMQNFFKEYYGATRKAFGIGLVQWDGYSPVGNGRQQKLVAFAIRNNYNWYDGWCQCQRIRGEWWKDRQYHFFDPVTIDGVTYTFDNYVSSTASPETLARAWQSGYEKNTGGLGDRGINARWWYNYFTGAGAPDPVEPEFPDPSDPDAPWYPEDPEDPLPDGEDEDPIWFWMAFILKKKKEAKRPCRKM